MDKDLAAVGKIIGVKGLRGEVKVQPLSDNFHRHRTLKEVKVIKGETLLEKAVENSSTFKNFWILKFKEIDSREEAEELKGCYLMVPKAEREELPSNSFYIDEILGLMVYDEEGEKLGEVIQVIETGSNDVFVVKAESPHLPREILVPALKDIIKEVDLEGKKMLVSLPEGLLD